MVNPYAAIGVAAGVIIEVVSWGYYFLTPPWGHGGALVAAGIGFVVAIGSAVFLNHE